MGQYFKAVIEQDNLVHVYRPQWLKLTEHAWTGEEDMRKITGTLFGKPGRVVWTGDYSDDVPEGNIVMDGEHTAWELAWSKDRMPESHLSELTARDPQDMFLVNHDKEEYLDFARAQEDSFDRRFGGSLHPLAILTAAGNGLGGGDYYGTDMELVGTWAGDRISVEKTVPEGYKQITPTFIEED